MSSRHDERGGSGMKVLIFLAVLGYAIYSGIMVAGAKGDDALIKHDAEEMMKFAGINKETPDTMRFKITKVAKDNDIPLKDEDLQIADLGQEWNIKFKYQRDIRLVFWNYKYDIQFDKTVPKG